jgi:hypothetical protein
MRVIAVPWAEMRERYPKGKRNMQMVFSNEKVERRSMK